MKNSTLSVRVDLETKALVEQYAAAYGTTPSRFIYEHLLKRLPKELPSVPQPTIGA